MQSPLVPAAVRPLPLARLLIPAGSFASGTEPGRFERKPELEPRTTRTALGAFEIDAAPYPGGDTPLLGLGREQAQERCAERGARLCTELEWERACKGPDSQPFPGGERLAPACERSPGCASGFGVWGMGSVREWTASDLPGRTERTAIVRGAPAGSPPEDRRCAHRSSALPASPTDVGFRCCYGAPNAARVVLPRLGAAFARVNVPLADLATWLQAEPATRAIAQDLQYFDEARATERVQPRGSHERRGLVFTSEPLAWNPAAGVELLVVTGRAGEATSFVVVFDALGDGSRRVASSFIMQDEPGPVALAYNAQTRQRLSFSTCWDCPGESGKIAYRDPDRAIISQP
jgi:hypothetical protein